VNSLEIRPVTPVIGAEVRGIDLARPLDEEAVAAIERALLEHYVLAFRDQSVPIERLIEFAHHFGKEMLG